MPNMPTSNQGARDARSAAPAGVRSRARDVDARGPHRSAAPREREIEAALTRAVEAAGGISRKWVSPGHPHVPDRIVVLGARVWFVEVKAPGKKPTAAQLREHERLASAGATVWVVDGLDGVQHLVECLQP